VRRRAVTGRRAAAVLLTLLGGGCATLAGARALDRARPGETTYHVLHVGGAARTFLLHLPPAARGPVPLVLVLHGHTTSGAVAREITGFDEAADRRGVAVAYPDGSGVLRRAGLSWNTGGGFGWAEAHHVDDVAFVDALVDTLAARRLVDPGRVMAVGFSAGGMLALRLGCERAARFAAIVDVAGVMPDATCRPTRPLRVLLVQGDADEDLRREHAAARALARVRGRGHRFATSLEAAFAFWARQAACGRARETTEHGTWRITSALGCVAGAGASLVTIRGHPHAWPGGGRTWLGAPSPSDAVDATALTLDLLAAPDAARQVGR
jgi:polyhydroxybutyrate depolymerase